MKKTKRDYSELTGKLHQDFSNVMLKSNSLVKDKFAIEQFVIIKYWDDTYIEHIKKYKREGVHFQYRGDVSLDFLKETPWLKAFGSNNDIFKDVEPIYYLSELIHLDMYISKPGFDYSHFRGLKECSVSLETGNHTLFQCKSLQAAKIFYNEIDCIPLKGLENLRYLELHSSSLQSLKGIENLTNLVYLRIYAELLSTFDVSLEQLSNLKTLVLTACTSLETITSIGKAKNLEELRIEYADQFKSIQAIDGLKNLKKLILIDCNKNLEGLEMLLNLPKLHVFEANDLNKLTSLNLLKNKKLLKRLSIDNCKKIKNVSFLETMHELEELELHDCGTIESLKPLSACVNLSKLIVEGTKFKDGDFLFMESLGSLTHVEFEDFEHYSHEFKLKKDLNTKQTFYHAVVK